MHNKTFLRRVFPGRRSPQ